MILVSFQKSTVSEQISHILQMWTSFRYRGKSSCFSKCTVTFHRCCLKQIECRNLSNLQILLPLQGILSFILIASTTNYMYAKFYAVWTIIFKVIAISRYSEVYCSLKYLHAVVTSYTYLLDISFDELLTVALVLPLCSFLKFGWWYSNQTWTVSSSMGSSYFTDTVKS